MTGLDLSLFLHLLRADFGAWTGLAGASVLLGLLAWTSWGSRRALRKCLVLSVAAHLSLVLYGSTLPDPPAPDLLEVQGDGIRQIRVTPWSDPSASTDLAESPDGTSGRRAAPWDRPSEASALALADPTLRPDRPEPTTGPDPVRTEPEPPAPADADAPGPNPPAPPSVEDRAEETQVADLPPLPHDQVAPPDPAEVREFASTEAPEPIAPPEPPPTPAERRLRPGRPGPAESIPAEILRSEPAEIAALPAPELPSLEAPTGSALPTPEARPETSGEPTPSDTDLAGTFDPAPEANPVGPPVIPGPDLALPGEVDLRARARRPAGASTDLAMPEADLRSRARPDRPSATPTTAVPRREPLAPGPLALNAVSPGDGPALPGKRGAIAPRPLSEVPRLYRSRLDPNRSALAQRAGASPASEQAVERALDWLARHQDDDGRWDGGSSPVPIPGLEAESRDSFTAHCPRGQPCLGECYYVEADNALTGLALLAYLGAGYTQTEGRYAEVVGRGLRFLLRSQGPDGDLRGPSRSVGMYCHAMAALALCEAYALTGDPGLREPVERAVGFLVRARADDRQTWRYAPGAPSGDTSILGWVVLVFKSAQEVGIPIPSDIRSGIERWLDRVAVGRAGGLAVYRPEERETPTMTAEAWTCRQMLGLGGPGPTSDEASAYLLVNGPDRGPFNLYYWYYATLAMYQRGGSAWTRWNAQARDQLVRRQVSGGHASGSWESDDDRQYGARGGRIYSTAIATLTLEVYYRYLRFVDEPGAAPRLAPGPDRRADPDARRTVNPAGRR